MYVAGSGWNARLGAVGRLTFSLWGLAIMYSTVITISSGG